MSGLSGTTQTFELLHTIWLQPWLVIKALADLCALAAAMQSKLASEK